MMLGQISLMPRLHCKRNIPCIVKRRLIQKLREIHRRANRRNEEILAPNMRTNLGHQPVSQSKGTTTYKFAP